jgi:hypothetical protein
MQYRIKTGYSFRDTDNSVKTGGDSIDLDAEAALAHAEKVDAIAEVATPETAAPEQPYVYPSIG